MLKDLINEYLKDKFEGYDVLIQYFGNYITIGIDMKKEVSRPSSWNITSRVFYVATAPSPFGCGHAIAKGYIFSIGALRNCGRDIEKFKQEVAGLWELYCDELSRVLLVSAIVTINFLPDTAENHSEDGSLACYIHALRLLGFKPYRPAWFNLAHKKPTPENIEKKNWHLQAFWVKMLIPGPKGKMSDFNKLRVSTLKVN